MAKSHTLLEKAFYAQRQRAKQRGIGWGLTFEDWLKIWEDSGHLADRGRGRGKYCMARNGDQGSYVVGNVTIISYEKNSAERVVGPEERNQRKLRMLGNTHGSLRINTSHSIESRTKMSESHRGKKTGRSWNKGLATPEEVRRKIAAGVSAAAKKRSQNAEA